MPVTQVSNEPAVRHYRSEDGEKVISVVSAGERAIRFVVDSLVREPVAAFVEARQC